MKLAFEALDLLGKGGVVAGEVLDFPHRVQHGSVVPAAEPTADLGQRPQCQHLGQVHRHLTGAHHIGGAAR